MTQYLVSSPTLPPDDLVVRWRAWKNHQNGIGAPSTAPFTFDATTRTYTISEGDLVWMMLEIERLRAAIEGLVTMDGGRQ